MTAQTLTDNDHLASKVALRVEAVTRLGEPREVRVLDAFHGHGRLWQLTEAGLPDGWTVKMFGSDKMNRGTGVLQIDNVRLLNALDLSAFDLIDLDAYGWPEKQLAIVAAKAPDVMVVSTRISRAMGMVPNRILRDLGVVLPKGTPGTLITHLADELWEAWLHHLGYRWSRLLRFEHGSHTKRYELLLTHAP